LSLYSTKHHTMKTYWGSGGIAPRILDLGTRWSEWSASRPRRFIPRERAPGTHWIGGWVGPRAVLDTVVKREIPSPRQESNLRPPPHPVRSPALSKSKSMILFLLIRMICFYIYKRHSTRRDSSVTTVTRLQGGRPGFGFWQGQEYFLFATASRPVLVLGPTQSPI
jgi:hypothetical protein